MLMVPPIGYVGSSHWIRWFLSEDTTVPPKGTNGSKLWK